MDAVKQNNRSIVVMNLIKMFCTIRRKKMDGNTSVQVVTAVQPRETAGTPVKMRTLSGTLVLLSTENTDRTLDVTHDIYQTMRQTSQHVSFSAKHFHLKIPP